MTIAYDVGQTNFVDCEVSLTRVNTTHGSGSQVAETPTATGNGPITLSYGSQSVEFRDDIVVDRSVGRPNSVVRRTTFDFPNYEDKIKAAYDGFEIGVEFTDNAVSRATTLKSMVGQKLGRTSLTLDFNGIYGLGAFDVVPEGSQALRTVRASAEQGVIVVPTLKLRRVMADG
ncbi:hypothetical protein HALLA_12150 [Halostagnicola larsenii XH-48]|uniref:Uncharacterized protein n=1 Tax=Halostagnicola larsenii XH-48 TaxID=797299 RepID=W0JUH3_9EURY|nr:hypothetical protein [Halostagnicola larsenii]AHG00977.1 hypothetical protein HALLA_12150 [Halostagnicola larsenii XH-48]